MPSSTRSTRIPAPEYVLLGLLMQAPAHGYELHQRLVQDLGTIWEMSLSQAYNILNRLESEGLIAGSSQRQGRLPERRHFVVTPTGQTHFEQWLQTPSPCTSRIIQSEFTTRLYFAQHTDPVLAKSLLDGQIAAARDCLAEHKARLAGLPTAQVYNRLSLDLQIAQMMTILGWLEHCRRGLNLGS